MFLLFGLTTGERLSTHYKGVEYSVPVEVGTTTLVLNVPHTSELLIDIDPC